MTPPITMLAWLRNSWHRLKAWTRRFPLFVAQGGHRVHGRCSAGGYVTRRSHKKILRLTKGQWDTKHRLFRRANDAMMKSLWYAYRDRRQRKRQLRALWIARINAAARKDNMSYSRLMHALKVAHIDLDRKVLADIAVHDSAAFTKLVEVAKQA